ncbi:MAG: alpha/beta hydrolase [Chitinophagaceae bacterium]|nr:alpha/beta hydrolase [Chitinophagaceae bacterium]
MLAKIGRICLKTVIWALVILIVLLLVFDRLVQFRMDDADLTKYFHKQGLEAHIGYYKARGREVRYIRVGDDTNATILFIHGAPSSLSYWRGYLSDSALLKRATIYALDRPGYGYSGLARPLPEIAAQAAVIRPILDSLHQTHHPIIVVGVSYGAPIASRLAMDYPQLVDGLVLTAPALAPGQERVFWFTYMIEHPLIHWVVPRMFQSANQEKIHHKEELTKMLPLWPHIHVPVAYLQGANDELVFTSNADFAREHLKNASSLDIQMIPGRGHLIAFSEKPRIRKAILDILDKCKK